jgi:hypothetical protein
LVKAFGLPGEQSEPRPVDQNQAWERVSESAE